MIFFLHADVSGPEWASYFMFFAHLFWGLSGTLLFLAHHPAVTSREWFSYFSSQISKETPKISFFTFHVGHILFLLQYPLLQPHHHVADPSREWCGWYDPVSSPIEASAGQGIVRFPNCHECQ